jgi:hypothetical protein
MKAIFTDAEALKGGVYEKEQDIRPCSFPEGTLSITCALQIKPRDLHLKLSKISNWIRELM